MEEETKKKCKMMVHDLSEGMIQHIQSFMTGKEAAQSTLLSKSWYTTWLTRPALDFLVRHPSDICEFEKFATKTIQRYRDSGKTIESFSLVVDVDGSRVRGKATLIAPTIISGAMEIGAVHLKLELPHKPPFVLPLTSQNLATLSVKNCEIEVEVGAESSRCSSLKSFSLEWVWIRSDDVFRCLSSSSSSSMEELSLSECKGGVALSRMNMVEFYKLRQLFLNRVDVDDTFFSDFATRFPCLNELRLVHCGSHTRVEIAAAASLERVAYVPKRASLRARFDVPNIRWFTYVGRGLPPPSLCVEAAAGREWDFAIYLRRYGYDLKPSWLLSLNRSLRRIRVARISLSLHLEFMRGHDHDERETAAPNPPPKPVVLHNLATNISRSCTICYDLMFRLFESGNISCYGLEYS